MKPSISTIIPVYNGARYLAEAVTSVLSQEGFRSEVIVVDDGSDDDSLEVARGFGDQVLVLEQANQGAAIARNTGCEAATGEWLSFLDADDTWAPDKFARQVPVLEKEPRNCIVFGHVEQFICPSLTEAERARLVAPGEPLPGYHVGTMLLHRDTFESIGAFTTEFETGEFIDWYARAVETGVQSIMLEDVLMSRRIHSTNQGIYNREKYSRDYLRILRASLARRRESGTL